jgi:hypothetical protein
MNKKFAILSPQTGKNSSKVHRPFLFGGENGLVLNGPKTIGGGRRWIAAA